MTTEPEVGEMTEREKLDEEWKQIGLKWDKVHKSWDHVIKRQKEVDEGTYVLKPSLFWRCMGHAGTIALIALVVPGLIALVAGSSIFTIWMVEGLLDFSGISIDWARVFRTR